MGIEVELTWPEILLATNVGVMRRVQGLRSQRSKIYAGKPGSWTEDINGALAELAVAKHYNLYWANTVGLVEVPDVGRLQVRSKVKRDHRLVIRTADEDAQVFVSVLVELPRCSLEGWMRGGEAKQSQWLVTDPGMPDRFFVPSAELHPMQRLRP